MSTTFDDCADIHGIFTIDAAGNGSDVYILGGIEISAEEYVAVQGAALARHINGVEG